jgi:HD-GYP domain-containing protein (c-di-GMP phosphodiesterase class II)
MTMPRVGSPRRHRPENNATVTALPRQCRDVIASDDTAPDDVALLEPAADRHDQRWVGRPVLARLVQLAVLAVPIGASIACAVVLSATLPQADDVGAALLWWGIVVVASTAVLFGVERVARQLLPLAVLLRLSLLFPDQAPKRYRVAARSWSSRRLNERLERVATGDRGTAQEAATCIIGLLASLSAHDRRTRGHCERVRAYNDLLAEEMGLPQRDRERLRWAALIHDIGKLAVPPRLLNKPAAPSVHEWEVLRAHPLRGAQIAAPLAGWLGEWASAIDQHHERWDGAGYPLGLAGDDISLGARIVAVADAFEVMTSVRPYSRPVTAAAARTELAACAGSHFDPVVVRAFLNISLGSLRKAMGPLAWFAEIPVLAGMPRLEAAIVAGGRQAVAGAGSAAGVVAVTALAWHPHAHAAPQHTQLSVAAPRSAEVTLPPAQPRVAATVRAIAAHRQAAGAPAAHPPAAPAPAVLRRVHRSAGSEPAPVSAPVTTPVSSPVSSPAPAPAPSQQSAQGPTGAGRCGGNGGRGFGNGGPLWPVVRAILGLPPRAAQALESAPGMQACSDK